MMSQKNMRLLAMADPWGLETGGLGACHECQGKVLKALGLGELEPKGALAKANGVVEGAQEGLKAASGIVSGLTGTWNGAEKFFMSLGGTVTADAVGVKGAGLPMYANTAPVGVDWSQIQQINVTTPRSFLDAVADYWLFYTPSWLKFGLKPPVPGGVTGQVWNPFKGAWQGGGIPIVIPADEATKKDVALVKQPTATGEARTKLIQKSVNTLGGANPGYGFAVAFANQVVAVKAGNYDVANRGYLAGADFPGLISTIRVLATPIQYVKTALATNVMFTKGPLTGELLEHVRVGWLKDLNTLVKSMPADKRPSNAGLLGLATTDGTAEGPTVPSPRKPMSPATTIGILAVLAFLARRFL